MNLTERVRRLSYSDLVLTKLATFVFGISVGSYLANYFRGYEPLLIVLAVLAAIMPMHTTLKK